MHRSMGICIDRNNKLGLYTPLSLSCSSVFLLPPWMIIDREESERGIYFVEYIISISIYIYN